MDRRYTNVRFPPFPNIRGNVWDWLIADSRALTFVCTIVASPPSWA
jgi:hypothetical protein